MAQGENHFEVFQKILENMIEHIDDIRSDQVMTLDNVTQILTYMNTL